MKGKTCCITGHRNLPQKEIHRIKTALQSEVDQAIDEGFTCFMSGFAEGVEQNFAEIVLDRKRKNSKIELVAVIPYQKRLESLNDKKDTYEMLNACSEVMVVQEKYHPSVCSTSM